MQHHPGNVALLDRPAVRPVLSGHAPRAAAAPEGVTVCVSGAVLAPAPSAAATGLAALEAASPVFVDDSGARKRLLRVVGILVGLLAVGFLGLVGVALAVPSVATSVGLGDAMPFVVPGAAAKPPAPAPAAHQAPVAKPKPKARPVVAAKPKPRVRATAPKTTPVVQAPVTEDPAPVVDETKPAGTDEPAGTDTPAGTDKPAGSTDIPAAGTDTPAAGTDTPAADTPAAGTDTPAGPDAQGAGQQAQAG